ncbi:MAG: glycosyltransferase family 1 protein [Acidobacteria bacterium]|nr:glycosyltransferase family 1 protein [Acidobacteriota bacterium]
MIRGLWYGGRGGSGGYIRYLNGLLGTSAASSDVQVSLLCSPSLPKEVGPLDPGVHVITVPSLKSSISGQFWERTQFSKVVRELRPDVLFYSSGSIVGGVTGVPVVAPCHSLLYFDDTEYGKYRYSKVWWRNLRRMRKRHRALYPEAAGVIFFSPYSQKLVVGNVPGIKRWAVIPHGVETQFLADTPTPTIERSPRNILYASTVAMYKHQWNVVRAIKQLRESSGEDYQLFLAGGDADGLGWRKLQQVLDQEQARSFTHVLGGVSHAAMASLYRKADLFVYASSCEAFGITLLEAMASGLPIACSRRTGLPDLLRDSGVYFDPEDSSQIASAVAQLCADKMKRRQYAERAMRYAREYTWSRCAERTFEFLRDVAVSTRGNRTT